MHIEPDSLPTGHAGIAARLKEGPTIHPTAWIVPGATIIGDVTLEEESSVWYGAVLRGDINRIVVGPRRQLTLDEQKDLARWARSYVESSKHFREFYAK